MSMKEAFETFFAEMDRNSLKRTGKLPRIPYSSKYSSKELLLLDTLDNNGYAVWRPRLQDEPVNFEKIESEIGFSIHPQIKEYLTTYWFRKLEGRIKRSEGDVIFKLDGIIPGTLFDELIRCRFNSEETHYLKDHKYFLIGTYCAINGVDAFLVQVNNDTCEVTAVDMGSHSSVKLADSIEDLLMNMKGKWLEI